jgi:hypothetical protein
MPGSSCPLELNMLQSVFASIIYRIAIHHLRRKKGDRVSIKPMDPLSLFLGFSVAIFCFWKSSPLANVCTTIPNHHPTSHHPGSLHSSWNHAMPHVMGAHLFQSTSPTGPIRGRAQKAAATHPHSFSHSPAHPFTRSPKLLHKRRPTFGFSDPFFLYHITQTQRCLSGHYMIEPLAFPPPFLCLFTRNASND